MTRQFSNEAKELIPMAKKTAERFGNNYIGVAHFLLCLRTVNSNRIPIRITLSDKKALIKSIKGKKMENIEDEAYPFTKQMELGLKSSGFHCWILGDKVISPEHIYLGVIGAEIGNKLNYLTLLKDSNLRLNKLKSMLIEFYFNPFFRSIGAFRILH